MDYNPTEQAYILKAIEEDKLPDTKRLHDGVMKVMEAFDAYEPTVEGYAGFKIDRNAVAKKKAEYKDDRNVGRVVNSGGDSMLITGKKADGRYIAVGKKGEKSARDAADLGVTKKEEVVGIDIDDLHQEMLEGLKQARANVGASKCWDGYKASSPGSYHLPSPSESCQRLPAFAALMCLSFFLAASLSDSTLLRILLLKFSDIRSSFFGLMVTFPFLVVLREDLSLPIGFIPSLPFSATQLQ